MRTRPKASSTLVRQWRVLLALREDAGAPIRQVALLVEEWNEENVRRDLLALEEAGLARREADPAHKQRLLWFRRPFRGPLSPS